MSGLVFGVIFIMFICGLLGLAIGDGKGRAASGFWLGLLLGVIGLAIVALMRPTRDAQAKYKRGAANAPDGAPSMRPCPWCAEQILPVAKLCTYCGRDLDPIHPPGDP